jgi:hypothetical protein
VAARCCSTAPETAVEESDISWTVALMPLIAAATESQVSWMVVICAKIDSVAWPVCEDRFFTPEATTAKPLPAAAATGRKAPKHDLKTN